MRTSLKNGLKNPARVRRSVSHAIRGPRSVHVKRTGISLASNKSRVLIRPFRISNEPRATNICARVLSLSEAEVRSLLGQVLAEFAERHQQIRDLLKTRYEQMQRHLLTDHKISDDRKLLIGAYFTHEYSVEAAALFNPSLVLSPDQTGVGPGERRVLLALRAVGEGHLSSIEFRSGLLDGSGNLSLDPTGPFLVPGHRTARRASSSVSG